MIDDRDRLSIDDHLDKAWYALARADELAEEGRAYSETASAFARIAVAHATMARLLADLRGDEEG
jgi:hypothetical protein